MNNINNTNDVRAYRESVTPRSSEYPPPKKIKQIPHINVTICKSNICITDLAKPFLIPDIFISFVLVCFHTRCMNNIKHINAIIVPKITPPNIAKEKIFLANIIHKNVNDALVNNVNNINAPGTLYLIATKIPIAVKKVINKIIIDKAGAIFKTLFSYIAVA
jgi:hypothetical protein